MHFQTLASIAILACATHVAAAQAQPQPYKLIKGPVLGISLARRSTNGYQPEQSTCGDGNTCEEACGQGYQTCPSNDDSTHCFNPAVKQSCCTDGSGNSCDKDYYCTHDTKAQTWCCPDSMDLVECAASYGVKDGLEAANVETTSVETTSIETTSIETTSIETTSVEATSAEPTTVEPTTSAEPTTETTEAETTTTALETTTAEVTSTKVTIVTSTEPATTKTKIVVTEKTSTYHAPTSSGYSTAWSGSNSTIAVVTPTQPSETNDAPVESSAPTAPAEATANGAVATGASALLLAVAGVFALL